jgi:hypothetical protein
LIRQYPSLGIVELVAAHPELTDEEVASLLVEAVNDLSVTGGLTEVSPRALKIRRIRDNLRRRRVRKSTKGSAGSESEGNVRSILEWIASRIQFDGHSTNVIQSLSGTNPWAYVDTLHDGYDNQDWLINRMFGEIDSYATNMTAPIDRYRDPPDSWIDSSRSVDARLSVSPSIEALATKPSIVGGLRNELDSFLSELPPLKGLAWRGELEFRREEEDVEWPRLVLSLHLSGIPVDDLLEIWDEVADSVRARIDHILKQDTSLARSELGRRLKSRLYVNLD